MRVGVDVRYLSHGITGGVRNYVFHLASELPRVAPGFSFFYYADAKAPLEVSGLPRNVVVRTVPWKSMASSLMNDRRIGHWMDRDQIEVGHFPANYGTTGCFKLVATVHDALNLFPLREHLRGFGFSPRKVAMMLYLGRQTRRTIALADHIITDSEHARAEIVSRSACTRDRITAVHIAPGPSFYRLRDPVRLDSIRRRYSAPRSVVVADAVKNPRCLVTAWELISDEIKQNAGVFFFSREPAPRVELASALARDARLRFVPQPSTPELVELLNIADVFVFPSFYEGFGLPLVEAMRCGAAIVASTRGSIPEVVGRAGLLFDVASPQQLASHLERLLADGDLMLDLRNRAMTRARDFDWARCARLTSEVYRAVHV